MQASYSVSIMRLCNYEISRKQTRAVFVW